MTQNKFKKIFVGGLPPQTTESDMREYFSKYGEVCDVVAMRDKTGNKSRGFGFVVFKQAESVDLCQTERPHKLLGKIVDTKRAMPKEESINPDIHCNSKRIFIGGLRRFFTEEDLKNYFRNFGQIVDCTIKRDNVSGASRGFAFITFTDRDIVDKVILSKPHSIRHCIVDVKKAMSPDELRQLDDNHNHQGNNQSDYDIDNQQILTSNQEHDDESKGKDKKTTKRILSYPQSEYPNYGYYMLPSELTSSASSPVPYPYDSNHQSQVPLIWMSVQQCAEGLILTPVGTDLYNHSNYPGYYSPTFNLGGYHQFFQSTAKTTNTAAVVIDNQQKPLISDTSGDFIDVSDLKKMLPTESNDNCNNHSVNIVNDYTSEETAFRSPNSVSL